MTTEEMRQWLLAKYPHSASWIRKVKAMSDDQVFVVYTRLKNEER